MITQNDPDLSNMNEPELKAEIMRLRTGIRKDRDATDHDLCWYRPELWLLLPEKKLPFPVVPEWPDFMNGCVKFRKNLAEDVCHGRCEEAGSVRDTHHG